MLLALELTATEKRDVEEILKYGENRVFAFARVKYKAKNVYKRGSAISQYLIFKVIDNLASQSKEKRVLPNGNDC